MFATVQTHFVLNSFGSLLRMTPGTADLEIQGFP